MCFTGPSFSVTWFDHAKRSTWRYVEVEIVPDRGSCKERIVQVLENSLIPMDVENVRLNAGMKNWESTKSILLEMVLQGAIRGQRTSRSWIFWMDDESSKDEG